MKFKLLGGVALAAVFLATGASAQEPGWYGAIDIGAHKPLNQKLTDSEIPPATDTVTSKTDWVGFARVGYQFDPHWRVELEGGYRPGKYDGLSGHANVDTVMANILYDIGDPAWSLRPFLGVGAGVGIAT